MKEKVIAIIVSTKEALQNALKFEPCNIYVDFCLYYSLLPQDLEMLRLHGYFPAISGCRSGVLFWHLKGDHIFDPSVQEIYDPDGIL